MNTKIRLFLWIITTLFVLGVAVFAAYTFGKQAGIEQAYQEISLQKIHLENVHSPDINPLEQRDILRDDCIFENGVKKCKS